MGHKKPISEEAQSAEMANKRDKIKRLRSWESFLGVEIGEEVMERLKRPVDRVEI
jgi:hypothetical protein